MQPPIPLHLYGYADHTWCLSLTARRGAGGDYIIDHGSDCMIHENSDFQKYPYGTVYLTKRLPVTLRAAPRAPPGGYQG